MGISEKVVLARVERVAEVANGLLTSLGKTYGLTFKVFVGELMRLCEAR